LCIAIQYETIEETISPEIEHWKTSKQTLITEEKTLSNPELTLY
jgi:hypothetical protein